MKQKILFGITFVLGIIFALIATFIMLFAGDEFLPLSITFLIVGIILISASPVLKKRVKS